MSINDSFTSNDIAPPIPVGQSPVYGGQASPWTVLGRRIPRSEMVYFTQVIMCYIVILVCIGNLSFANGDSNLWTALLSSTLGYLLPSPTMKTYKNVRSTNLLSTDV